MMFLPGILNPPAASMMRTGVVEGPSSLPVEHSSAPIAFCEIREAKLGIKANAEPLMYP